MPSMRYPRRIAAIALMLLSATFFMETPARSQGVVIEDEEAARAAPDRLVDAAEQLMARGLLAEAITHDNIPVARVRRFTVSTAGREGERIDRANITVTASTSTIVAIGTSNARPKAKNRVNTKSR